ncbi:hypothetical protein [Schinkia azotoformans]|uniref:hypothetical protein n=1 Tax=Schinkia azotoformans TaxID=1454 RepID=UPI000559891B|nr:hypothetical protein [Schinkia azotoformans]MEC1757251.1 hypothetical protein [Schinkia azotoformans]MEC1770770.1 hypothetical protein [Schinkia azotoformans]
MAQKYIQTNKYLGLISVIILLITLVNLPNSDWKIGVLGIILGLLLAVKAPKSIWKYVAYVIFKFCTLLVLFLVAMGILMAGLMEISIY